MKRLVISLMFLGAACAAFSQLEEKIKKEGVVPGIIYKDGGEIEGYIKKTGMAYTNDKWFDAPWEFQGGVKFIPKDVFEKNEKIKNSFYEKYEPEDCDAYKYDTLMYESVKYADMSAVGMNMLPKKMFMHRIQEGKVTLFNHFDTPPPVVSGEKGAEPFFIACATPHCVYRVGKEGKLKLINNLNVEKELADCPKVVEKQSKGEYKVVGNESNNSGLNKLINNAVFRDDVRLMAIEDYNNCN